MLITESRDDHFMVGRRVRADGFVGRVEEVLEHTVDDDGDRETQYRVVIRSDDGRERDVDSSLVEVLEG